MVSKKVLKNHENDAQKGVESDREKDFSVFLLSFSDMRNLFILPDNVAFSASKANRTERQGYISIAFIPKSVSS